MNTILSPQLKSFSFYIADCEDYAPQGFRFLLLLAGTCQIRIQKRLLRLKAGSLLLLGAGCHYALQHSSKDLYCNVLDIAFLQGKMHNITFAELPSLKQKLENYLQENGQYYLLIDNLGTQQRMVNLLQIYMASSSLDKAMLIHFTLYALLKNTLHNLDEIHSYIPHNRHISQSIKYLRENFAQNISAIDIAEHVHVHVNYLHQIFQKHTGQTIVEYLSQLRMEHAKQLLASTNLSIENIALQCSYENSKYFYKVFKKIVGCTPTAYRKNFNLTPFLADGKYTISDFEQNLHLGTRKENESA